MILQTLDIQDNCSGIFSNGTFKFENFSNLLEEHTIAWKHSPVLDDERYKYLYLLTRGRDISLYSSDPELFSKTRESLLAQRKAAKSAKIDLTEACFFDLLPEHQFIRWFSLREQALENLNKMEKQGPDYDILHKIHVLSTAIARQDIHFGGNKKGRVLYNIFGSATGRLTTEKTSVPVMTMRREQRELLRPQNDVFVELDLNAAEIRMLIALSGRNQPEGDIHEWVVKNVFEDNITREQAKVQLFAWLYNPSNSKSDFDKFFSREIFRDFYFSGEGLLTTPFGRRLSVEERKAQNYLLQSTTSDQVLENAYKIHKMLKDKKTNIAFTLHDSIILDMSKEDAIMLRDIKRQFEKTRWGNFVSTCKIGKTFGTLKELKI